MEKISSFMRDSIVYIWNHIKSYFKRCKTFLLDSFSEIRKVFKKWPTYVLICSYAASIVLSSFAFYDNTFQSIYADSIYISEKIIDNKYLDFTFQSYGRQIDLAEFNRLNNLVYSMNEYTYENSFTFLSTSSGLDSNPRNGKIVSISKLDGSASLECEFSVGAATFSNYNNEIYETAYFAGTHLEKIFNAYETLSFNSFGFDGKDSSSFISTSFADYIINLSEDDEFKTYEDLIGTKIDYLLNGMNYSFSVNNLYNSKTSFGPAVSQTLGDPIITNSSRLFTSNDVSIYSSCIKSALDLRELFYQLGPETNNGYEFICYYVDENGKRVTVENDFDSFIINDLENVGSDDYSMLYGLNLASGIILLLVILFTIVFSFIISLKSVLKIKPIFLLLILFSISFLIIDGIVFASIGNSILSYKICNMIVGFVGSLLPILVGAIFIIARKIKMRRDDTSD